MMFKWVQTWAVTGVHSNQVLGQVATAYAGRRVPLCVLARGWSRKLDAGRTGCSQGQDRVQSQSRILLGK